MALEESGYLSVEDKNKVEDSKGWMRVFSYLATALVICYMQTFFIQRSSMIAQGLVDGRDSGPDFASRLTARAATSYARSSIGAAAAPLRATGGLIKGGIRQATSDVGQKLMNSGHSTLGAFLRNTVGVKSTKERVAEANRSNLQAERAFNGGDANAPSKN